MAKIPIPHPLPEFPVEVEVQEDGSVLIRAHPDHVKMKNQNYDYDVRGGWITKTRYWIEIEPPRHLQPQIYVKVPVRVEPKPKATWTERVGMKRPS